MREHLRFVAALVVVIVGCGSEGPGPQPEPKATAEASASATATATTTVATTADPEPTATTEPTETAVASATSSATASAKPGATGTAIASATPSATSAPTASAAPVTGEEKKDVAYSTFMSGAGSYKAGEQGAVTAVVNALGEYKVNDKFPFKFTLNAAPAGVTYPETTVRNVTKAGKKAVISIPFTPASKGSYTISGTYSFSVCTESKCLTEKIPLSVAVKVE